MYFIYIFYIRHETAIESLPHIRRMEYRNVESDCFQRRISWITYLWNTPFDQIRHYWIPSYINCISDKDSAVSCLLWKIDWKNVLNFTFFHFPFIQGFIEVITQMRIFCLYFHILSSPRYILYREWKTTAIWRFESIDLEPRVPFLRSLLLPRRNSQVGYILKDKSLFLGAFTQRSYIFFLLYLLILELSTSSYRHGN